MIRICNYTPNGQDVKREPAGAYCYTKQALIRIDGYY